MECANHAQVLKEELAATSNNAHRTLTVSLELALILLVSLVERTEQVNALEFLAHLTPNVHLPPVSQVPV